jgi:hypothetical protein
LGLAGVAATALALNSCRSQKGNRGIALARRFRYVRRTGFSRGLLMADHAPNGPLEMGADMDYSEHEKTYLGFLLLAKYGSLVCLALLAAMAFGFFTNAGFFSALFLFLIICAVGIYLIRRAPRHVA